MDIDQLKNDLRRNGYTISCTDSYSSKIITELFSDLCAVMAIVDNGSAEAPIKQKVSELKTLHQSNASHGYNLRNKEHCGNHHSVTEKSTFNNSEQDVNYRTMIERNITLEKENLKLKFELDETIKNLHEAVEKAKGYAERVAEFEKDFKELKSYSGKLEHQIESHTAKIEARAVKNGKQSESVIEKGLNEEIDRLRIKIGQLEQHGWQFKNYDTQKIIASQQNEIDDLKQKQKTEFVLKSKYVEIERDRNQLKSRIDTFEKEIAEKGAKIHEMDKKISSNKRCPNEPKTTNEELKTECHQLQIQIDSFRQQVEEKNEMIFQMRNENESDRKSFYEMQKFKDMKLECAEVKLNGQICKNCRRRAWPELNRVNIYSRSANTNNYNYCSRARGESNNLMDVDNFEPSAILS